MVPVAKPVFWCKYYLLPFFVSTHVPQHWATSTGSCPFAIWDKTIVKSVSTVLTLRCWYLYVTSVACIAYPKYKLVLSFFCLFFFPFGTSLNLIFIWLLISGGLDFSLPTTISTRIVYLMHRRWYFLFIYHSLLSLLLLCCLCRYFFKIFFSSY